MKRPVGVLLVVVGIVGLILFGSFSEWQSGPEAGVRVGWPDPWLDRREGPDGVRWAVNLATTSGIAGVIGVGCLIVGSRLSCRSAPKPAD
jgi:hypothetical protein